jgi:hypothetical protein
VTAHQLAVTLRGAWLALVILLPAVFGVVWLDRVQWIVF